jgi:hypothetical protein
VTKPKSETPVQFPAAFRAADEEHQFLRKYKRSLEKRLRFTRMETLFEEVDLAIYLLAVGRDAEALEVASFLPSQISFTGSHNIWSPVGSAITVTAFLHRKAGNDVAVSEHLARLLEHPCHAHREPEFHRWIVEEQIPKEMEEGWGNPSRKWACHILARAVGRAIYWRETNVPGFPHCDYYSNDVVERHRTLGLERLRLRMAMPEHAGAGREDAG